MEDVEFIKGRYSFPFNAWPLIKSGKTGLTGICFKRNECYGGAAGCSDMGGWIWRLSLEP
jgi:hypothetical protein